jgi:hypothetical protein
MLNSEVIETIKKLIVKHQNEISNKELPFRVYFPQIKSMSSDLPQELHFNITNCRRDDLFFIPIPNIDGAVKIPGISVYEMFRNNARYESEKIEKLISDQDFIYFNDFGPYPTKYSFIIQYMRLGEEIQSFDLRVTIKLS